MKANKTASNQINSLFLSNKSKVAFNAKGKTNFASCKAYSLGTIGAESELLIMIFNIMDARNIDVMGLCELQWWIEGRMGRRGVEQP